MARRQATECWRWVFIGSVLAFGLAVGCGADKGSSGLSGSGGSAAGTASGGTGGSVLAATCANYCVGAVDAACAQGPFSRPVCEQQCQAMPAVCATELEAYLSCAGTEPTFVCDPAEGAVAEGCGAEVQAMGACIDAVEGPGIGDLCTEYCATAVSLACPGGPPTVDGCTNDCIDMFSECQASLNAYIACGGESPQWACVSFGPALVGCEQEMQDSLDCAGIVLGAGGAGG